MACLQHRGNGPRHSLVRNQKLQQQWFHNFKRVDVWGNHRTMFRKLTGIAISQWDATPLQIWTSTVPHPKRRNAAFIPRLIFWPTAVSNTLLRAWSKHHVMQNIHPLVDESTAQNIQRRKTSLWMIWLGGAAPNKLQAENQLQIRAFWETWWV